MTREHGSHDKLPKRPVGGAHEATQPGNVIAARSTGQSETGSSHTIAARGASGSASSRARIIEARTPSSGAPREPKQNGSDQTGKKPGIQVNTPVDSQQRLSEIAKEIQEVDELHEDSKHFFRSAVKGKSTQAVRENLAWEQEKYLGMREALEEEIRDLLHQTEVFSLDAVNPTDTGTPTPHAPTDHADEPRRQVPITHEASEDEEFVYDYNSAKRRLVQDLATADVPTFAAIMEFARHRELKLSIQASPTNIKKEDADEFLALENDLKEKRTGPDRDTYSKADKIFSQAISYYERAASSNASKNIQTDQAALVTFQEDFKVLAEEREKDIYREARLKLAREMAGHSKGTPLYNGVIASLQYILASSQVEYYEALQDMGDGDENLDRNLNEARKRKEVSQIRLTHTKLPEFRKGDAIAIDAFNRYRALSSADDTIPSWNITDRKIPEKDIAIAERVIADVKKIASEKFGNFDAAREFLIEELAATNREPGSDAFRRLQTFIADYDGGMSFHEAPHVEMSQTPNDSMSKLMMHIRELNPGITEDEIQAEWSFLRRIVIRYSQDVRRVFTLDDAKQEEGVRRNLAINLLKEHLSQMDNSKELFPSIQKDPHAEEPENQRELDNPDQQKEYGTSKRQQELRLMYQTAQRCFVERPELVRRDLTPFTGADGTSTNKLLMTLDTGNISVTHFDRSKIEYNNTPYNNISIEATVDADDGIPPQLPQDPSQFRIRSITIETLRPPGTISYSLTEKIKGNKVTYSCMGSSDLEQPRTIPIIFPTTRHRFGIQEMLDQIVASGSQDTSHS